MKSIHPFLESDIRYQIQLLDYLYIKESQWISIEELTDEVGLQPRSVLKYVLSIEEIVKNEYSGKLFFEMQGNQSFKLMISENRFFFDLRVKIIEKSVSITIWNKLFFSNELNIVKFSLESFSSLSTIKRKIKKLNSVVSSFNFKITSRDNIYTLKGNEANIRFFFSFLFWDVYNGVEWPFYNIDQIKVFNLINQLSEKLDLSVSYSLKNRIAYNHAVGITRYFHNQPIILEKNEEWYKLIKINNRLVKTLPINVIQLLKEDYLLSDDEAQYEFSRMQIGQSFYQNRTTTNAAIKLHEKFETAIYKASCNFCELLEKRAELQLSESLKKQILIPVLCGHYKAFLYHEMPILKLEVDGIISNYYALKDFVRKIYEELNTNESSYVFKQENFLINQYMYIISGILPLNYFEKEISIYFDELLDYSREVLVKKMLINFFQEPFNLRIYGPSDIPFFDKNKIDIVLSSFYTDNIIDDYPNTPIIFLKLGILNLSGEEILLFKEALTIINVNREDKSRLSEEFKKNRKIFINEVK